MHIAKSSTTGILQQKLVYQQKLVFKTHRITISAHFIQKLQDVWSWAVICWELFSGQLPYDGMNNFQIIAAILEKRQVLHMPEDCPVELWQLLQKCWCEDTSNRPSFLQVMEALVEISRAAGEGVEEPKSRMAESQQDMYDKQ